MDRKEAFDTVLAMIDEDKREEVTAKLREVDTREEKLAILESYGVSINSPEDILGDEWEETGVELTDEELALVAGGEAAENTWKRDCNCEP